MTDGLPSPGDGRPTTGFGLDTSRVYPYTLAVSRATELGWTCLGALTALVFLALLGRIRSAHGQEARPPAGALHASSGYFAADPGFDKPPSGVLWVVDRETRRVAAYRSDGQGLALVGMRNVFYDLKLKSVNDRTERWYTTIGSPACPEPPRPATGSPRRRSCCPNH